jgi:enamine deaminase RidA (YjgF/YER057c/UK114 family)
MKPTTLSVSGVPTGSYALGRSVGGLLFLAGQIPVNAEGELVSRYAQLPVSEAEALRTGSTPTDLRDEPIVCQTWAVYDNIARLLAEAGSGFPAIVAQRIYMVDVNQFPGMERVRNHIFQGMTPPTTTAGGVQLVIPDVLIEIEVVAALDDEGVTARDL